MSREHTLETAFLSLARTQRNRWRYTATTSNQPIRRRTCRPCADPGIFVRGVLVSLTKKALTTFFFFFFFFFFFLRSSAYFTEVKWSISKKSVIFQGSRRGPTLSRGGSNFFQGGSNCLFPIETHITCVFTGGGGPDPLPPLWIRTCRR